jgi:Tol biopolymer transport system component
LGRRSPLRRTKQRRPSHQGRRDNLRQRRTTVFQDRNIHINSDGTNLATIPIRPGHHNNFPAWSPDGTKIALASSQGQFKVYVTEADGSGLRRITDSPTTTTYESDPAWSPDGKRLAFSKVRGDIYTIKLDGTGLRQLTDTKDVSEAEPAWSPDGKQIAFSSSRAGDNEGAIFVMEIDKKKVRQLTETQAYESSPDWRQLP